MHLRQRLQHIYYILLCILAFSISLPYIFASISVVLLAICWLVQFDINEIKQRLRNRKLVWLWLLFFAQISLSYFYSTDKSQSAIDIQKKLSLLILPLAIGLGPLLNAKRLEQVFTSFISGLVLVGSFCIARGGVHYLQTGQTDMLFYHPLVSGLNANAVYYASYTIFAAGILLLFDFKDTFLYRKGWWYIALPVIVVFFVLQSSKSLLVLFVIFVLPLYLYKQSRGRKISLRQVLTISAIALIGVSIVLLTENPIKARYREMFTNNAAITGNTPAKGEEMIFNNVSLRVFLWKMAWSNIKTHDLWLTGCGNGDVTILQKEKIDAFDAETNTLFKQPDLSGFNLHNMYLQVLMTIGIPGLIVFLLITLSPLAWLKKMRYKYVFLVFIVTYFLFMMQESALQTQAGVIYFAFFSQVILLFYYSGKETSPSTNRAI